MIRPTPRQPLLATAALLLAQGTLAGTLYDPASSSLPTAQGWSYGAAGPAAQSLGAAGLTTLDTGLANALQAGYYRADQLLDSNHGVMLSFSAGLLSESHARNDRAGFAVIALDSQHRGIELGFWSDQVWAQSGPAFTHAESTSFATGALTDYALRLQGGSYTLSANGAPLLSGALRDYASFGAPYGTANLLFFGDDTTSARAVVQLGAISVTAVPEPGTLALLLGGLGLIGLRQHRQVRIRPSQEPLQQLA
ncbi:MAG: PEP-CTERM sorting domain-containing protein [Leptothrix sp. (in: b-proteobacteria)]